MSVLVFFILCGLLALDFVLSTLGRFVVVLRHCGQVWIGHPIGHPRPTCLLFFLLLHTIPGVVFLFFIFYLLVLSTRLPPSIPPTSGSGVSCGGGYAAHSSRDRCHPSLLSSSLPPPSVSLEVGEVLMY